MAKIIDINSSTYAERDRALSEALIRLKPAKADESAVSRLGGADWIDPVAFSRREPPQMSSTGFDSLDSILGGGVCRGMSVGIGGVYGGGKSILLLQMAAALASAGAAVLYATPELTREEILARAAARHIHTIGQAERLSFGEIRRMRHADGRAFEAEARSAVASGLQAFAQEVGPRFDVLRFSEGEGLELVRSALRFFRSVHMGRLVVLVVDPIQRLAPAQNEGMPDEVYRSALTSESERISLVCSQVKDFADAGDISILWGSDANSASFSPGESASAGFRGGPKVGNAATTMFFLDRPRRSESVEDFAKRTGVEATRFACDSNPLLEHGLPISEESAQLQPPVVVTTYKNREGANDSAGMRMVGHASALLDCALRESPPPPPTSRHLGEDWDI